MYYFNGKADENEIYLATSDRRLLGALNGVKKSSVVVNLNAQNTAELSFEVDRYIDGIDSSFYTSIVEMMQIYVDGIWYIINEAPKIVNNGKRSEYLEVVAESAEIQLQNFDLQEFEVGTGNTNDWMMRFYNKYKDQDFYKDLLQQSNQPVYVPIVFYDDIHPERSLLHIILAQSGIIPSTVTYDENGVMHENWVDNIEQGLWKIGKIDTKPRTIKKYDGTTREVYLPNEVYAFSVDNQDVYSFLTQDVSQAFQCIFTFDTDNRLINATYVDNIGEDTNVFIGWRNIQENIEATKANELYTSATVRGGDGFGNVLYSNFGDSDIEDYSYFMDEKFVPKTLIDKYNSWVKFRDEQRPKYVEQIKQYMDSQKVVTELDTRVPNDTVSNDWEYMDTPDLETAYTDNTAIIKALENTYVDSDGNFDFNALKNSADWSLYEQTMNYVLPSIISALQNKDDITTDTRSKIISYGTGNIVSNATFSSSDHWDKTDAQTTFAVTVTEDTPKKNNTPVFGITSYAKISGNTDFWGITQGNLNAYNTTYMLSFYVRSSSAILIYVYASNKDETPTKDKCASMPVTTTWTRQFMKVVVQSDTTTPILKIGFFGDELNTTFDICGVMLERGDISSPSDFVYFQQSEDEIKNYKTDYKLYGVTELKNLLEVYQNNLVRLQEYKKPEEPTVSAYTYYSQCHQLYLDYETQYNACKAELEKRTKEYDNAVSAMTGYQKQMNDIAHSVQRKTFGFTDEEERILQSLYKHTDIEDSNIIITDMMNTQDILNQHADLLYQATDQLYQYAHPQYTWKDTVNNIVGLEEFKNIYEPLKLFSFVHVEISDDTFLTLRIVSMSYNPCIYDGGLTITFSTITDYKNHRDDFSNLLNNSIRSAKNSIQLGSLNQSDTISNYIFTPEMIRSLLSNGLVNRAISNSVSQNFGTLTGSFLTANTISTKLLEADQANIDKLSSKMVTANVIETNLLNADQAFFDKLSSKVVSADAVTAQLINANILTVDKQLTDDLIAQKATLIKGIAKELTVADLSAGDITVSDKMRIISENGAMVMDGTKLQISGKYVDTDGKQKSYVGVQLGYDTSNQPSLILRNPQGAVVLSPDGITKDAIADGLIDNDMVKDNSLSKDKLGFDIIEPNEYGGIDIAKVYDGNGNQFGVEYTSFKNNTADKLEQLDTDIQNSQTYQVYIDTPNGTNIGTGEITLKAKLMKNSEDVTDQFDAKYFIWERKSNDADADLYWNDQHSTGAKSIQVTANDVKINAVFQCRFEKND